MMCEVVTMDGYPLPQYIISRLATCSDVCAASETKNKWEVLSRSCTEPSEAGGKRLPLAWNQVISETISPNGPIKKWRSLPRQPLFRFSRHYRALSGMPCNSNNHYCIVTHREETHRWFSWHWSFTKGRLRLRHPSCQLQNISPCGKSSSIRLQCYGGWYAVCIAKVAVPSTLKIITYNHNCNTCSPSDICDGLMNGPDFAGSRLVVVYWVNAIHWHRRTGQGPRSYCAW